MRGPPKSNTRVPSHTAQIIFIRCVFNGHRLIRVRACIVLRRMFLSLIVVIGKTRCCAVIIAIVLVLGLRGVGVVQIAMVIAGI